MKRHIVFLIDGSDDVRNRFSAVREFVFQLVQSFDLDRGKDKVALVQYSNDAELSFNLDAYNTKDDVLKHISRLKPKGGRPLYIGVALQFVKDNVFFLKRGGQHQENVKRILIVFSSGRSRDSPRGAASSLKDAGVIVFSVGSRLSSPAEMRNIAFDSNYVYSVPDFVNLRHIQQIVLRAITEMRDKVTKDGKIFDYFLK